jgi:hypothetical protein
MLMASTAKAACKRLEGEQNGFRIHHDVVKRIGGFLVAVSRAAIAYITSLIHWYCPDLKKRIGKK